MLILKLYPSFIDRRRQPAIQLRFKVAVYLSMPLFDRKPPALSFFLPPFCSSIIVSRGLLARSSCPLFLFREMCHIAPWMWKTVMVDPATAATKAIVEGIFWHKSKCSNRLIRKRRGGETQKHKRGHVARPKNTLKTAAPFPIPLTNSSPIRGRASE